MYTVSVRQTGLIVITLLTCISSAALADRLSFSTGTHFTSGKYGNTTSTEIWYVPFTARYDSGRSSFRVTVPYINITGSRNVLGSGIDGSDIGGGGIVLDLNNDGAGSETDTNTRIVGAATRRTQDGLGDIIAAYTYNLINHRASKTVFNITGRIKIPTASLSRRLGSGQVDYAIQSDLFKSISDFNLRATFGYRILGNPSGVNFRNVFYGRAGAGYRISSKSMVGTSFNIGQSTINLQDSRTLSVYYSHRLNNSVILNIYGLRGLSDRSPDWGSGITLRYIFGSAGT